MTKCLENVENQNVVFDKKYSAKNVFVFIVQGLYKDVSFSVA